jgi:hypothetical protein
VGTWSAAFRFDGVRFVPWSPPATSFESHLPFRACEERGILDQAILDIVIATEFQRVSVFAFI